MDYHGLSHGPEHWVFSLALGFSAHPLHSQVLGTPRIIHGPVEYYLLDDIKFGPVLNNKELN